MNKMRRKSLLEISEQLEELKAILEDFEVEEEDCLDNMPENLQGSERYEKMEDAIANIAEAICSIEEACEYIEAAVE